METQTRFDLDAAIAKWQAELAVQPDLTPVVRRELETHLRDTLAELQTRGLNKEESFWLARRRVGQPNQLGEEFAKADPSIIWRERVFWMVAALLVITLWGASVDFASTLFYARASLTGIHSESYATIILMAKLLLNWGPIVLCAVLMAKGRFQFGAKKMRAFLNSRFRLVAIIALWILFNSALASWVLFQISTAPAAMIARNLLPAFLRSVIWPLLLVGLLKWLTPRKMNSSLEQS